jgi:endonuclease/exonuclease/phosphatase family metal-dependent hydrolase
MSLTVYTANLQHGVGTDGVADYARQITALSSGDLIGVQERESGTNFWASAMAAVGMVEAVYRENDPTQNDGNAIWYKPSKVTILGTYQHDLSQGAIGWNGSTNVDKSVVAAKCRAEGKTFYFVNTHLAWDAGADSDGSLYSATRVAQINTMLNWINTTLIGGLDVLIVGDMNFGPDYPKNPSGLQIDLFTAGYVDLWQQAITKGVATAAWGDRNSDGTPDMPITSLTTRTYGTRRIDYCFLSNNPQSLALAAMDIPDLRETCPHGLVAGGVLPSCEPEVLGGPGVSEYQWDTPDDFGVRPSDHNFIKLTLNVDTAAPTVVVPHQFSWFPK